MYMVIRFLENESALCLSFRLLYDYVFTQRRTWPSPVDWLPTEHWFLLSQLFFHMWIIASQYERLFTAVARKVVSFPTVSFRSCRVHLYSFFDNLSQYSCIQRKQSFWITCLLTTLYLTIAHFFKPNHNGLPIKYRLNLSFLMSCQEGKLWRMHARFGAFNSSELSVFFDCKISRSIQIIRKCECSISCVTIFLHVFFKQRIVRLTIAPAHRLSSKLSFPFTFNFVSQEMITVKT